MLASSISTHCTTIATEKRPIVHHELAKYNGRSCESKFNRNEAISQNTQTPLGRTTGAETVRKYLDGTHAV